MIAKIKTRADFGGIVNYANDQKNKKKSAILLAYEGVCAIIDWLASNALTNMRFFLFIISSFYGLSLFVNVDRLVLLHPWMGRNRLRNGWGNLPTDGKCFLWSMA